MYDYLVVGSGLFGSVFACEAKKAGKRCLVLEKREHIGGNCATENIDGVNASKYGPHILNTSNEGVWSYLNSLCEIEPYRHTAKVKYKDKLYSFPINMHTFQDLWGCGCPIEAQKLVEEKKVRIENPTNFKEWVLSNVGEEIFEIFYKGYSEKQWNRKCEDIPCFIAKRMPIRYTFDDSYHETKYSGMPKNADYNPIFHRLLDGIEVKLDTDFEHIKKHWKKYAKKLVYTGPLDELLDYKFGFLEYRSLNFYTQTPDTLNYQCFPQINYSEKDIAHTRIIEHQWFSKGNRADRRTVITKEYPDTWEVGKERYYPVNDQSNKELHQKYKEEVRKDPDIIVGGRLGLFVYLNMDQVIAQALTCARQELHS